MNLFKTEIVFEKEVQTQQADLVNNMELAGIYLDRKTGNVLACRHPTYEPHVLRYAAVKIHDFDAYSHQYRKAKHNEYRSYYDLLDEQPQTSELILRESIIYDFQRHEDAGVTFDYLEGKVIIRCINGQMWESPVKQGCESDRQPETDMGLADLALHLSKRAISEFHVDSAMETIFGIQEEIVAMASGDGKGVLDNEYYRAKYRVREDRKS